MVSEEGEFQAKELLKNCLNPCFSGGWSRRQSKPVDVAIVAKVLILVLVEDGLGGSRNMG